MLLAFRRLQDSPAEHSCTPRSHVYGEWLILSAAVHR